MTTSITDDRATPGHYLPNSISTEQPFADWSRQQKEQAIELLIAQLDAADGEDDLEIEDEHDEDDGDREPNLGAPEGHFGGSWARGGDDDLEADDSDHEASLGWTDAEAVTGRCAGSHRRCVDLEEDGGDAGLGDLDGMKEQVHHDWSGCFA